MTLKYWVPAGDGLMREIAIPLAGENEGSGVPGRRVDLLARMLEAAAEADVCLSYRDLMLILLVSRATLKRDFRSLRASRGVRGLCPSRRLNESAGGFGRVSFICGGRRVHLSLVDHSDCAVLGGGGLAALRRARLLRLAAEADVAGMPLGYDELSVLLATSKATLKRDVTHLEQHGSTRVKLRGRRAPRRIAAGEACAAGGATL